MGIRRWLRNWLNDGSELELSKERYRDRPNVLGVALASDQRLASQDRVIRLCIYNASGGRIVETNKYDSSSDRTYNNLYIITSDNDFGKELEKILTMESLRG